jgi:predicted HicB family RNase H-like nuclease
MGNKTPPLATAGNRRPGGPMPSGVKEPFTLRMDTNLRAYLQKKADAQNRNLSNYVETKLWELAHTLAAQE